MPEDRGVDYVITTSIRLSAEFLCDRESIWVIGTLPFDELDVQRFSEIRAHPQNIVAVSLGHNPGSGGVISFNFVIIDKQ